MALTQLIVLAVLQSLADVFPIGADGHTALVYVLLHWATPDSALRLALRIGLLLGVMAYFWRDLADMVVGVIRAAKGKRNADAGLALQIAVAAIPTLGLGFAFEYYLAGDWQTLHVAAWAIVGGALLLLFCDRMSMTVKRVEHATYADSIVVGLGQVIALVPGIGSAAMSITLARLLGFERGHAVRLSALLSIPVSAAVIARDAYTLFTVDRAGISNLNILCGVAAFFAALIGLAILMGWLRRATFAPFVVVRLVLGLAVLALAYEWVTV